MKVLFVTGYKPMEINVFTEKDERINIIKAAIEKQLINKIDEGLEWVLISGKMGVELWTGSTVLQLRESYGLKLAVIPPFENQDERWPEPVKALYQQLIQEADFYKPLYKGSYRGSFQYRASNTWLINKSDGCLMLLDEEFMGSNWYIYQTIQQSGKDYEFDVLTPDDLEDIAEDLRLMDPDEWL